MISRYAPYRLVTAASFGPGNFASGWNDKRYSARTAKTAEAAIARFMKPYRRGSSRESDMITNFWLVRSEGETKMKGGHYS